MRGRARCRQSSADPWRTIRALVRAAKLIAIDASTTQMPVEAGGGEESFTAGNLPSAGTMFRQPALPELPVGRGGSRRSSIFGGSGTVVAIRLIDSNPRIDYASSGPVTFSGEVCITKSPAVPSTPYWYGSWKTSGSLSPKLLCGGGVVGVLHSKEVACHGLSVAGSPLKRL